MSKRTILLTLGVIVALVVGWQVAAFANHPEVSLQGSNFEIEDSDPATLPGANLVRDDDAPSEDWGSVAASTEDPPSADGAEVRKADAPTGKNDNSFGEGTKEDDAVPTVVAGRIPNNKSDLLNFGVYLETTPAGQQFLNVFWHRVQEPSGTTNMDFEFNQSEVLSANNTTPVRTAGDLLIQYDLAQGGTSPQLFLSTWLTEDPDTTNEDAVECEAANSYPCWGIKQNLSGQGLATGSINNVAITDTAAAGDPTDGLATGGTISPRTFGEAQIDFDAIVGGSTADCTSFGSAYLKSRSSDSFTAALKDFIAPADIGLDNCANVIIRKQTDPDGSTQAFRYSHTIDTDPALEDDTETTDIDESTEFDLVDGGARDFNGTVLQGTGYTVTETVPTGWDLTSIDCSASDLDGAGGEPASQLTTSLANGTVTFNIDSNDDLVDCTYNNRSRGTIVVEKITDDGQGAFNFTSNSLGGGTVANPHTFTLTTSGAGAANKDSKTFSDLTPGTYDVAETVPAGWNLVSSSCVDSDGPNSTPGAIALAGGETVTCTFHDARERGAILITKTRKHAADGPGDHPHSGVTFTVTGGSLPAGGTTVNTGNDGTACVDGLVLSSFVGDYTVTETVPSGYVSDDAVKEATVAAEATCSSGPKAGVSFENTPLTDLTVSVNSQVNGGTASTVDCNNGGPDLTTGANGDGSATASNLTPKIGTGAITCTIVIDP